MCVHILRDPSKGFYGFSYARFKSIPFIHMRPDRLPSQVDEMNATLPPLEPARSIYSAGFLVSANSSGGLRTCAVARSSRGYILTRYGVLSEERSSLFLR